MACCLLLNVKKYGCILSLLEMTPNLGTQYDWFELRDNAPVRITSSEGYHAFNITSEHYLTA